MPPQVNMFFIPQQQEEHQQPQSENERHDNELSSIVEELRRQVSNLQNQKQQQAERHEKERLQWEKERQNMTTQLTELQTAHSKHRIALEVESKIKSYLRKNPLIISCEIKEKLIKEGICDEHIAPSLFAISEFMKDHSSEFVQIKDESSNDKHEPTTGNASSEALRALERLVFQDSIQVSKNPQTSKNDSGIDGKIDVNDVEVKQTTLQTNRQTENAVPSFFEDLISEKCRLKEMPTPNRMTGSMDTGESISESNTKKQEPTTDINSSSQKISPTVTSTAEGKRLHFPEELTYQIRAGLIQVSSDSKTSESNSEIGEQTNENNIGVKLTNSQTICQVENVTANIESTFVKILNDTLTASNPSYSKNLKQREAFQQQTPNQATIAPIHMNILQQQISPRNRTEPIPSSAEPSTCETSAESAVTTKEDNSSTEKPTSQTVVQTVNPTANVKPTNETSKSYEREQREAALTEYKKLKQELMRAITDMHEKSRLCKTKREKRQVTLDFLKKTRADTTALTKLTNTILVYSLNDLESSELRSREEHRAQEIFRKEHERIAMYLQDDSEEEANATAVKSTRFYQSASCSGESSIGRSMNIEESIPQRKADDQQQFQIDIGRRVDDLSLAVGELRLQTTRLEGEKWRLEEEIRGLKSQLSQHCLNASDSVQDHVASKSPKSSSESYIMKQKQLLSAASERMLLLRQRLSPQNKVGPIRDGDNPYIYETNSGTTMQQGKTADKSECDPIYANVIDRAWSVLAHSPTSETSSGSDDTIRNGDNFMESPVLKTIRQVEISTTINEPTDQTLKSHQAECQRDSTTKKRQKHRSLFNFKAKIEELNRREAEEEKQQRWAYEKAVELGDEQPIVSQSNRATFESNWTLPGHEKHGAGSNMKGSMYERYLGAKERFDSSAMDHDNVPPPCKPRNVVFKIDQYGLI